MLPCMVWVWVVTTAFVVVTFITVKLRGYKRMPHALRDAIAADAIFGAPPTWGLLLLTSLLLGNYKKQEWRKRS